MASEAEVWWTHHFTSFSIRDLQALKIFNKFTTMHYPFNRDDGSRQETFTLEPKGKTLEWTHKTKDEGEKFSYQSDVDTWFYEHRYYEGETHITSRSWLNADKEWGEIVRQYREYAVHENWRLQGSDRRYDRYTVEADEKRGLRTGRIPALEGMENWTETFWEQGEESESEKVWSTPNASGGENKHSRGAYWWGEVWHRADDHTEMKYWHTHGDHDWGHTSGEACGKVWSEVWDTNKTQRQEERYTKDGDRHQGFRYIRNGADWYRQEWDGLNDPQVEEGKEPLWKVQFRHEIDELSVNGHDRLLRSEHTLELLLREAAQFTSEVEDIKKERLEVAKPDSSDVDSLFKAIRAERELADKQEQLKQRMIDEINKEHGKYYKLNVLFDRVLKTSQQSLNSLVQALKHDETVPSDVERWRKTLIEHRRKRNYSSYDRDVLALDDLVALERDKNEHILKLVGGLERKEVQKAMEILMQIIGKQGAGKIGEPVTETGFKETLDSLEQRFKSIHSTYLQNPDSDKLHESLTLLLAYQPLHLQKFKEEIEDLEAIIESKSEEIAQLLKLEDENKGKIRTLETELLEKEREIKQQVKEPSADPESLV